MAPALSPAALMLPLQGNQMPVRLRQPEVSFFAGSSKELKEVTLDVFHMGLSQQVFVPHLADSPSTMKDSFCCVQPSQ